MEIIILTFHFGKTVCLEFQVCILCSEQLCVFSSVRLTEKRPKPYGFSFSNTSAPFSIPSRTHLRISRSGHVVQKRPENCFPCGWQNFKRLFQIHLLKNMILQLTLNCHRLLRLLLFRVGLILLVWFILFLGFFVWSNFFQQ